MECIIEYAEVEGTHKDHGVQLLSPAHPQDSHHELKTTVQTLLNSVRLGAVTSFLGVCSSAQPSSG